MLLKKKTVTVDSILSAFTTAVSQLQTLVEQERNAASADRKEATVLLDRAYKRDHEANRAVTAIEKLNSILPNDALPIPATVVEEPANVAA